MKKSTYMALVLGVISGLLFSLGICMTLLPQWNAFKPGIVLGSLGITLSLIALFCWRKMEKKPPFTLSSKTLLSILLGIFGTLLLGVGMCCCMVWNNMILGIAVGIFAIVILLSLIPLLVGIKK